MTICNVDLLTQTRDWHCIEVLYQNRRKHEHMFRSVLTLDTPARGSFESFTDAQKRT